MNQAFLWPGRNVTTVVKLASRGGLLLPRDEVIPLHGEFVIGVFKLCRRKMHLPRYAYRTIKKAEKSSC
jgi:hypothetical protein